MGIKDRHAYFLINAESGQALERTIDTSGSFCVGLGRQDWSDLDSDEVVIANFRANSKEICFQFRGDQTALSLDTSSKAVINEANLTGRVANFGPYSDWIIEDAKDDLEYRPHVSALRLKNKQTGNYLEATSAATVVCKSSRVDPRSLYQVWRAIELPTAPDTAGSGNQIPHDLIQLWKYKDGWIDYHNEHAETRNFLTKFLGQVENGASSYPDPYYSGLVTELRRFVNKHYS